MQNARDEMAAFFPLPGQLLAVTQPKAKEASEGYRGAKADSGEKPNQEIVAFIGNILEQNRRVSQACQGQQNELRYPPHPPKNTALMALCFAKFFIQPFRFRGAACQQQMPQENRFALFHSNSCLTMEVYPRPGLSFPSRANPFMMTG